MARLIHAASNEQGGPVLFYARLVIREENNGGYTTNNPPIPDNNRSYRPEGMVKIDRRCLEELQDYSKRNAFHRMPQLLTFTALLVLGRDVP